ncbi:MAG: hypothetical protein ACK6EB_20710, partial [Planctomyces sp.]
NLENPILDSSHQLIRRQFTIQISNLCPQCFQISTPRKIQPVAANRITLRENSGIVAVKTGSSTTDEHAVSIFASVLYD